MIVMGDVVMDAITGFVGTIVARWETIGGECNMLVAPPIGSDGAFRKAEWFEVSRLAKAEPA